MEEYTQNELQIIGKKIENLDIEKQNLLMDNLSLSKQKDLLKYFSSDIQEKKLKESPVSYWRYIAPKVQATKIKEVIEQVKEKPDIIRKVWMSTNSVIRLSKFSEIFEIINLNSNREYYESIVKEYLGYGIEFYENGAPYVPEDLKNIISKIEDSQQAEMIEKNLIGIIKSWDTIKLYIQLKRAHSTVKDGIEIRKNSINEILNAVKIINRPIANSISAQEFEQLKGAERIGVDIQYTTSPSTAVQRAHTLAELIDKASCQKAYPDFSVKNEEGTIELNVLHPQAKSAILLGTDTKSCFRPNGDADNNAKNEYSLLQYCTTTPYGGVLRCESADKKEIYMGTPILVSGNCMMLHSYETANGKKADETNELLVEAAKSAIKNSNDSIDIVFMTTLYTGNDRLHTENKIIISNYFSPYTEGKYSQYSNMYNNLDKSNCILAVRVGNLILSGKNLVNWYKKNCHESPEELKRILGLHMGERTQRFDFGRREIEETIEIPEYKLIKKFDAIKSELEQSREILALVLQIKKLESKNKLSKSEYDELSILKSKVEGKIDISKIEKVSIDEIREKIKQNKEKQLALYSGEDIDLIADVYGIDIKTEARKKVEEKLKSKKTKDKKKSAEGKAISILLAKIRECKDERVKSIEKLNEKITKNQISDEELTILEQAGIDVTQYRSTFRKNEEQDINSQNNGQINIEGQVGKIIKDKAQKEEIVSEILWGDISEEEIKTKLKSILRISLIDELKRKIALKKFKRGIENLTEEEIALVIQEAQMINKDELIESIMNGNIEPKYQTELKKYEINIEDIKAKISNEENIKHAIRKDKLEKLKAEITLGIETKSKIQRIKYMIDGERDLNDNIAKIIYGLSWYIALDYEGNILCSNINTEIDKNGVEQEKYEKTLKKLEEHKKSKLERLEKAYIKNATEQTSAEGKQNAIKQIKQEMKNGKVVVKEDGQ